MDWRIDYKIYKRVVSTRYIVADCIEDAIFIARVYAITASGLEWCKSFDLYIDDGQGQYCKLRGNIKI